MRGPALSLVDRWVVLSLGVLGRDRYRGAEVFVAPVTEPAVGGWAPVGSIRDCLYDVNVPGGGASKCFVHEVYVGHVTTETGQTGPCWDRCVWCFFRL